MIAKSDAFVSAGRIIDKKQRKRTMARIWGEVALNEDPNPNSPIRTEGGAGKLSVMPRR
jgi:hypothetical protein